MENQAITKPGEFESLQRILEQLRAKYPGQEQAIALNARHVIERLRHFGPDEGDAELLIPPRDCDGELRQLRADQRQAIESILAGATYEQAARDTGVDRRTLYRWMNKDSAFADALDNQRRRMVRQAGDRLVGSAHVAATALCAAAEKGNIGAATNLLKLILQFQKSTAQQPPNLQQLLPAGTPRQIQMRLREMLLSLTTQPAEPSEAAAKKTPALPDVEPLKMEGPQPQATSAPGSEEEK